MYPTYQDYQNSKELKKILEKAQDSIKTADPEISDNDLQGDLSRIEDDYLVGNDNVKVAREKRVKLGLDLQGGMYLVMEVNTTKLLERLAKQPDDTFNKLLAESDTEARNGDENVFAILVRKLQENNIALSRYFGNIRQDDAQIISEIEEQESDAVSRAMEIIRNRVDQYGVSEPSIQKQGSRRIIVELPGVAKEEEAKRLLQGRALLEFKLVKEADFTFPVVDRLNEVLASKDTAAFVADSLIGDLSETEQEKQIRLKYPFTYYTRISRGNRIADGYVLEKDKDFVENLLKKPEVKNVIPDNVEFLFSAKADKKDNEGRNLYTLYLVNKDPELTGGVIVDAYASRDPGTGEPVVSMTMNSEGALEWARITGANVHKRCAVVLDGKVYTAPVINERIPSGRSQISGSDNFEEAKLLQIVLKAGALPAPVEIIEERTVGPSLGEDSINKGLNSSLLGFLLVALFMIFYYKRSGGVADMALAFTLIFTMGVLAIFHATLTLPGIAGIILTIGMAVDANVLIYERIYEEYATGKTLKASVDSGFKNSYSAIIDSQITTFFTAIILYNFGSGPVQGFALTLMIGIIASLFSAFLFTKLIFDMIIAKNWKIGIGNRTGWLDSMNFDFIGKRKMFYVFSGTLIAVGIISLAVRGVEFGIDFKGGSEIALKFEKPVNISEVRSEINKIGLGNVEIKTFGGDDGLLIRTELQELPHDIYPKVLNVINRKINSYSSNIGTQIVDSTINSVVYAFDTPEDAAKVSDILFAAGFQAARASMEADNKQVQVRIGIADWIEENLRETFTDNSFTIAQEQKVGPKIGKELKEDALLAIFFALIVIMVYLGIRFKFGFSIGAVLALFHDVLITIGVFSLLYGVFSGFNLEVSVSVVAGFLTLVGYSINDTVVVFDRIRENLKIHKTAPLEENINKAINKTMRRTLVTSGTTLLSVTVLLFGGGDVLRGFSFALFFGIIIGTYSSIGVASAFVYEFAMKTKKKLEF